MLHGVDVSAYQSGLPTGLDFYWIKATEGLDYTDSKFPGWLATVRGWGKQAGLYHFFRPGLDASYQAQFFLNAIAPHAGPDVMTCLDHETAAGTPAQDAAAAAVWCRDVTVARGAKPVVYTDQDFAGDGRCAGLGSYPLWLARPGGITQTGHGPWPLAAFQQYSQAPEDLDVFFGTAADLAALTDWSTAIVSGLKILKQGDTGLIQVGDLQSLIGGVWRQAVDPMLPIDHNFGPDTTAQLKRVQGRHGLTADGVCGPKTWALLLDT